MCPRQGELYRHPENRRVLDALLNRIVPPSPAETGQPWSLGGFDLRTHPDLHLRLQEIARGLPPSCETSAWGCPLLAVPGGLIFALAAGTRELAFRLPERLLGEIRERGGEPAPEYGPGWVRFDPWCPDVPAPRLLGDLTAVCEAAFVEAGGALPAG